MSTTLQTIITVAILAVAALWLARYAWRFLHPANKPGCPGGCCSGDAEPKRAAPEETEQAASPPRRERPRQVMISSDDLRARVKARQH